MDLTEIEETYVKDVSLLLARIRKLEQQRDSVIARAGEFCFPTDSEGAYDAQQALIAALTD